MPEEVSEAALVTEAVEEAVEHVEQGDRAIVAVDYVACEQGDLEHRFTDILRCVREEVEDD